MAQNQPDVSVWALADLATPMAVRVVATLRIADHITRGLRTEMDLRVLVYFGGKERGVAEVGVLAESAGLKVARVHPAGKLAVGELRSMRS